MMLFLLFAYPRFARYAGCKLICKGMTGRRRIKSTEHSQWRVLRRLFARLLRQHQFLRHFALHDINGRPAASSSYPFSTSGPSRNALLLNLSVPVCSCWNGMVAFNAALSLPPSNPHFCGLSDSLAEWHVADN